MPIEPKSLRIFLEKSCESFRHKLVKEYEIFLLVIDTKYNVIIKNSLKVRYLYDKYIKKILNYFTIVNEYKIASRSK